MFFFYFEKYDQFNDYELPLEIVITRMDPTPSPSEEYKNYMVFKKIKEGIASSSTESDSEESENDYSNSQSSSSVIDLDLPNEPSSPKKKVKVIKFRKDPSLESVASDDGFLPITARKRTPDRTPNSIAGGPILSESEVTCFS